DFHWHAIDLSDHRLTAVNRFHLPEEFLKLEPGKIPLKRGFPLTGCCQLILQRIQTLPCLIWLCAKLRCKPVQRAELFLNILDSTAASQRFDTPDTRAYAAFAGEYERANLAGFPHMNATA